jgi:hypothetical protein
MIERDTQRVSSADAALLMMTRQGRNTKLRDTIMTATITAITATTTFATAIAAVAENEAVFQATNGEAKTLRDAANVSKIVAYSHLIEAIIDAKIKKGTKRAGELRAALEAAGISKACAKRYCEIGQAAAKLPLIVTVYEGADSIVQVLEDNDIRTEAALKNVCFPTVEKTLIEKLVDLAKANSDDTDAAVQALLDAASTLNPGTQYAAPPLAA